MVIPEIPGIEKLVPFLNSILKYWSRFKVCPASKESFTDKMKNPSKLKISNCHISHLVVTGVTTVPFVALTAVSVLVMLLLLLYLLLLLLIKITSSLNIFTSSILFQEIGTFINGIPD